MKKYTGGLIQELPDSEWLDMEKEIKKSMGTMDESGHRTGQIAKTPQTVLTTFDEFDAAFGGFGSAIIQSQFARNESRFFH